jgi:hypothetical protein
MVILLISHTQILLQALAQKEFNIIIESTIGAIFLGTPHKSTETEEYGQVLTNIAKALIPEPLESDQRLYNALRTNSDRFLLLTHVFVSLIDCPIYSFFETKPDKYSGVIVSGINRSPKER